VSIPPIQQICDANTEKSNDKGFVGIGNTSSYESLKSKTYVVSAEMLLYLPVSCGCINLYLNVLFYGLREIIVRKRKKKLFASRFRGSRPLVALARRSFRVDVAVAHRTEGHGLLHVGIIMIPSLFGYDGRHLSVEVFQ